MLLYVEEWTFVKTLVQCLMIQTYQGRADVEEAIMYNITLKKN